MADTFAGTIVELRQSLLKAKELDLGADAPQEFTLGVVIQIMNECERRRQECIRAHGDFLAQARAAEYQANAFSMVSSIAQQVYNGFIQAEERSLADRKAREAEREDEKSDAENEAPTPPPKKRGRAKAD